jgi:hypothetical protein
LGAMARGEFITDARCRGWHLSHTSVEQIADLLLAA